MASSRPKNKLTSLKKPYSAVNSKATKSEKKSTRLKRKYKKHEDDSSSEQDTDHLESVEELDSDALDEDVSLSPKKRKTSQRDVKRSTTSPKKRRKKSSQSEEENSDDGLLEGQTVVGKVVQAPVEGRVPPGQISQNTFDFLKQLAKPECNDREWFKLHEPVYRQAEKEWKDWIEAFTSCLTEIDDQIPELPPKDVIHRIYRDVRFSNDKTPYKQGFSASFSRSGRKGIFAHFIPNGQSLIAAGAWQPGKNELSTIRHHIQHDSSRLRNIISDPEFVKFFGEASSHPKRERQNVFGHEDELKVAPKGIDKSHKDIDLLKLRSIAVVHNFLDSEVTAPDFKENVCKVVKVLKPLVHCLNDMITLPVDEGTNPDNAEE